MIIFGRVQHGYEIERQFVYKLYQEDLKKSHEKALTNTFLRICKIKEENGKVERDVQNTDH